MLVNKSLSRAHFALVTIRLFLDGTHLTQTHHELIRDDVQSQTTVKSGLKKHREFSIKGLVSLCFLFGRQCCYSCNLYLAESLSQVLPFLSRCTVLFKNKKKTKSKHFSLSDHVFRMDDLSVSEAIVKMALVTIMEPVAVKTFCV